MDEYARSLNRRDFLKLAGASIAGYVLYPIFEPQLIDRNLEFLDDVQYVSYLTPELQGVSYNIPFIWEKSPEVVKRFRESEEAQYINLQRLLSGGGFMNIEKHLNYYDEFVLDKMEAYIASIPKDQTVIISILNGYNIFRSDINTYIYEPQIPDSPYLRNSCTEEELSEIKENFFKFDNKGNNPKFEAYAKRADLFIKRFGIYQNVIFEIGNEIESVANGKEAIEQNTTWYNKAINHIRINYKKTLLTGVTDPEVIDYRFIDNKEQLVTTSNEYYPLPNVPLIFKDRSYPQPVPVVVKEIGIPWKFFNRLEFKEADHYLKNFILGTVKRGIVDKVLHLGGIGWWQVDPEHVDFYNATKERYRETFEMLEPLSQKLKGVFQRCQKVPNQPQLTPV